MKGLMSGKEEVNRQAMRDERTPCGTGKFLLSGLSGPDLRSGTGRFFVFEATDAVPVRFGGEREGNAPQAGENP